MNTHTDKLAQDNYVRLLQYLQDNGTVQLQSVKEVHVFHDACCRLYTDTGICDCDPTLQVAGKKYHYSSYFEEEIHVSE